MSELDPQNPFPLLKLGPEQYPEAKRHAAKVDEWLGLMVKESEAKIEKLKKAPNQECWVGHHPSIFLTPYVELRAWLEQLQPQSGQVIVDLGAGYGRLGFVLARHFPSVHFLGFEILAERVRVGSEALKNFGAINANLLCADISCSSWLPPIADIYFIYDYGTKAAIGKTLNDLRKVSMRRGIQVVGRGRSVRDQIEREHPWLGSVHRAVHYAHYSIYRSFS